MAVPLLSTHMIQHNAKLELDFELAEGYRSPCGFYDVVILKGKLYRTPPGLFEDVILKAPVPSRYWCLPRILNKRMAEELNYD